VIRSKFFWKIFILNSLFGVGSTLGGSLNTGLSGVFDGSSDGISEVIATDLSFQPAMTGVVAGFLIASSNASIAETVVTASPAGVLLIS